MKNGKQVMGPCDGPTRPIDKGPRGNEQNAVCHVVNTGPTLPPSSTSIIQLVGLTILFILINYILFSLKPSYVCCNTNIFLNFLYLNSIQ